MAATCGLAAPELAAGRLIEKEIAALTAGL